MLNIHANFIGGNIDVKSVGGDVITLENQLRDSPEWFYWAFCVEGACGRELTFQMQKHRLGYWGPAVSHDLKSWHWLENAKKNSFSYRFGKSEKRVYFAHHLLYHPHRFSEFLEEYGLCATELCRSRKGRSVPCLKLGGGEKSIILTARHHACESTGSYVLEGVLRELIESPLERARILCVPFVDYDGVLDGDQGKDRFPHDHNRDYIASPLYPEVRKILEYADRHGCHYGFDFHSPWHRGGENDNLFIVRNRVEKQDRFDRFSEELQRALSGTSIVYSKENDRLPMRGWNQPSPNFAYTMNCRPTCDLAFSLETPYFGTAQSKISPETLIELGRHFAKAIKAYIKSD